MKVFLRIFTILFVFCLINSAFSQETSESGLALPRMVSIRADNINARSGPGTKYPIEWVYKQKGAPLEIINEFELWRQVRDWEGDTSWIHKTRLTGRRFIKIITPGENNIYAKDNYDSKVIAKAQDGVIGEIKKCPKGSEFCLVKFDTIEGWIAKKNVFGVYENEVIK
ncbi:MAG: hypothetical protein IJ830_06200 [Alphaproteobacteria bacterium]|nr:hypothetical protein [Alphaproteobacteria bacterium]